MGLYYPDYSNSILNISATLAEHLGAPNKNITLPILTDALKNQHKNVVFICFDGLGIYPIQTNLHENDFLFKNTRQVLRSTFPSTTTNATTSFHSNQFPLEHGWFGWSMHYPSINRNVDIFMNRDSETQEAVHIKESPIHTPEYFFDHPQDTYEINTVFPSYVVTHHPERNYTFSKISELFSIILSLSQKDGRQFIYAYCPEPDATMHMEGVKSVSARQMICMISALVETLCTKLRDTLVIITADHGQVDMDGHIELYADDTLMNMLKIYPYLEARVPAFQVKSGMQEAFASYFSEK